MVVETGKFSSGERRSASEAQWLQLLQVRRRTWLTEATGGLWGRPIIIII